MPSETIGGLTCKIALCSGKSCLSEHLDPREGFVWALASRSVSVVLSLIIFLTSVLKWILEAAFQLWFLWFLRVCKQLEQIESSICLKQITTFLSLVTACGLIGYPSGGHMSVFNLVFKVWSEWNLGTFFLGYLMLCPMAWDILCVHGWDLKSASRFINFQVLAIGVCFFGPNFEWLIYEWKRWGTVKMILLYPNHTNYVTT